MAVIGQRQRCTGTGDAVVSRRPREHSVGVYGVAAERHREDTKEEEGAGGTIAKNPAAVLAATLEAAYAVVVCGM